MQGWLQTWQRLAMAVQAFSRKHWSGLLRLRQRVRVSQGAVHLVLGGVVGVLGGLVNLLFYALTDFLKELALRHRGDWTEIARSLEWWQCLLTPALGGLAAGFVLHWGLRTIGLPGAGSFLEAVAVGDGRLRFRTGALKALSSLLTISSGGSIGREGPIIHFSATLASKFGQGAGWPPYRLRLLVACGAAAGLAAAYNAPLGGAVFAAQIVLGNFSMHLFAPLVVASVVASVLSRSFFGISPWYQVPMDVEFTRIVQLPWFAVLGFLAGALGAGFLWLLRQSEALFARLRVPLYVRLALGGLVVGAIALWFPEVWGNGYGPTNQILHGNWELPLVGAVFAAKLLAILATVGSGAVGGVFTPTLFLGAGLGAGIGGLLHLAGYATELPTAAFVLVGMGSLLAATTHSPLLAIILLFEISLDYTLMPPLMVACAIATLVARRLHRASVYTEPLRRRGVDLNRDSARIGAATEQTVGDLMHPPVPPLRAKAGFREITDRFLTSSYNFLPVVDNEGRLLGMVALQDLKEHLGNSQDISALIAYDIMRPPPPCLTPDQTLAEAVPILLATEQRNVPVVTTYQENKLVGAIARAEALGLLSEAFAALRASRE